MKRGKNTIITGPIAMTILAMLLLPSCNHKDLEECDGETGKLTIVFDWSKAADADPESMGLNLYEKINGTPMRFSFSNKIGGEVRIIPATYDLIAYNNDNIDWAEYRDTEGHQTFEIRTSEVTNLHSSGVSTRSIPRSEDSEDQKIVQTPGMLWTTSAREIVVNHSSADQTIILYPEESICHYTVRVKDVKNLDSMNGLEVDATVSGLAEGYHPGKGKVSSNKVIMPFNLSAVRDQKMLEGNFLSFGTDSEVENHHTLTIYVILEDGTKRYYTFDVTDQVNKAPDPRHVLIEVKGLDLPEYTQSGGFVPNVNEWQHENVDIKM